MSGTKTCNRCWRLRPCPVPGHEPKRSSWSPDRDRAAQHRFRTTVLHRDMNTCRRCGHHDTTGKSLVAHHDRPGMDASCGRTLCHNCHRAVDGSAR